MRGNESRLTKNRKMEEKVKKERKKGEVHDEKSERNGESDEREKKKKNQGSIQLKTGKVKRIERRTK